jgi:hypothetical protein
MMMGLYANKPRNYEPGYKNIKPKGEKAMTRKKKMNADILRHGFHLKRIFFDDPYTGISALQLSKSVHRIEVKAHRIAEDYCNGIIDRDAMETADAAIMKRLYKLLGKEKCISTGVFYNHDPRGYALKISDDWTRGYTAKGGEIHRDWGGYGILAPEFDGR